MGTATGGRRVAAGGLLAVFVAVGLAGCSSSGPKEPTVSLPAASDLLQRSAAKMKAVPSARFELTGKGRIAGVEVDRAEGVVTSDGRAQGIVKIVQAGSLVELEIVVVGGDIYIKGPTGTFQKLPPGAAGTVFDPSQILSHDRGLASLMEFARRPQTVGEEQVEGVDAYEVTADLDGSLVSRLMPLPAQNRVPGTLWIGKASPELEQIMVTVPQTGSAPTTELTLRLFDFGVKTNITRPS